jgi:ABC-type lipoprotein release transport system permease subunit
LASQIYAVNAVEPGILGVAISALAAAGLRAASLPARRAARVDPMRVLRED